MRLTEISNTKTKYLEWEGRREDGYIFLFGYNVFFTVVARLEDSRATFARDETGATLFSVATHFSILVLGELLGPEMTRPTRSQVGRVFFITMVDGRGGLEAAGGKER